MDRSELSAIAHRDHPVMAPLSDASVGRLLQTLDVEVGGRVIDIGCGRGEWLVRLLQLREDLSAVGVDTSEVALAAARETAAAAGVIDRVQWVLGDAAAAVGDPADAALCIGSTHAFGGLAATLSALRERVVPGGHILLGEGFWELPPTPAALEVIGDLPDLPALIAACHEHGWHIVAGHVSTAAEWDAYEWSWVGSLTRWALDHGGTDGDQAREVARRHLEEWTAGYRNLLGFVTLVLRDGGSGTD